MATEEQIRALAYSIWEEEGHPEGKDLEHYLHAKKILEDQAAKKVIELGPPPPVAELASPPKQIHLPQQRSKQSIRGRHKKK